MSGVAFEAIESLPVNVAVLDRTGTIVGVNQGWRQFGRDNDFELPESGIGANYLDVCERSLGGRSKLLRDLKALLSGDLQVVTLVYPCHSPRVRRWFMLMGVALGADPRSGAALFHIDVSGLLPDPIRAGEPAWEAEALERDEMSGVADGIAQLLAAALQPSLERALASLLARNGQAGAVSGPDGAATELQERVQRLLSRRQLEVLALIGEGKSNLQIAKALSKSPNTVRLQVSAILKRLQLSNRTEAALLAARLRRPC